MKNFLGLASAINELRSLVSSYEKLLRSSKDPLNKAKILATLSAYRHALEIVCSV